MPTYKFSNFPKATVVFGKSFHPKDCEKLQENVAILNKFVLGMSQVLKQGQKIAPKLSTAALITGKLASVMVVLVWIVGEVDVLYKELKNTEQKIFSILLEGKLQALKRNVRDLENPDTQESQKIAELVTAISHFDELLPIFANNKSIFRERYYIAAPLFAQLCTILKAVSLIAEQTAGFNTDLQGLKEDYQEVLDWYKIKCIGGRMASCYGKEMMNNPLNLPGGEWTYDWKRHYKNYKKYYKGDTLFPWNTYAENLGGTGWRLWYGWLWYCNLIDTWDTRSHDEVEFEPIVIRGNCFWTTREKEVLAEYRRRVEEVMLQFFNDVSLIIPE